MLSSIVFRKKTTTRMARDIQRSPKAYLESKTLGWKTLQKIFLTTKVVQKCKQLSFHACLRGSGVKKQRLILRHWWCDQSQMCDNRPPRFKAPSCLLGIPLQEPITSAVGFFNLCSFLERIVKLFVQLRSGSRTDNLVPFLDAPKQHLFKLKWQKQK